MKIQPISNQSFTATLAIEGDMKEYMKFLNAHTEAADGWYNSTEDLRVTSKIIKAFKKHPSPNVVFPSNTYIKSVWFNARGTLKSKDCTLYDTEPSRSDSFAGIQNVLRRILDPENKSMFNKLLGVQYSWAYSTWWNEHIKPIWPYIQKNFRETTFFKGNYDKEFNEDFRKQGGQFWKTINERNTVKQKTAQENPSSKSLFSEFLTTTLPIIAIGLLIILLGKINKNSPMQKTPQSGIFSKVDSVITDTISKITPETIKIK